MTTTSELLTYEEVVMHLSEDIPGFLPTLAAALGVTVLDLKKDLAAGQITKLQAIAALAQHAIALNSRTV